MLYYLAISLTIKRLLPKPKPTTRNPYPYEYPDDHCSRYEYKLKNLIGIYDSGQYKPSFDAVKRGVVKQLEADYGARRVQVTPLKRYEFAFVWPEQMQAPRNRIGLTLWDEKGARV